ncbi:hypothetical protein [Enterococcus sp. CWB-B31]|uniref:hypothetical protein n=1 Tax=Enterococcus sp. CWB-B31 TaxID=2885159 RepID=UPI001E5B6366|nr:hypothetical protein [Enterococcus sp. CWB-B31]
MAVGAVGWQGDNRDVVAEAGRMSLHNKTKSTTDRNPYSKFSSCNEREFPLVIVQYTKIEVPTMNDVVRSICPKGRKRR